LSRVSKVGLPKRERLLSVVGGNASSCPKADLYYQQLTGPFAGFGYHVRFEEARR
jgi:hypothetical protein